jgi:hypothetical protein
MREGIRFELAAVVVLTLLAFVGSSACTGEAGPQGPVGPSAVCCPQSSCESPQPQPLATPEPTPQPTPTPPSTPPLVGCEPTPRPGDECFWDDVICAWICTPPPSPTPTPKPEKEKCNKGGGNGPEGCDPGNNPDNGNDDEGDE